MILKESCFADEGQVTMKSSDATPSHTVVRYGPLITVVMCELIVLGYSNTSVRYVPCRLGSKQFSFPVESVSLQIRESTPHFTLGHKHRTFFEL